MSNDIDPSKNNNFAKLIKDSVDVIDKQTSTMTDHNAQPVAGFEGKLIFQSALFEGNIIDVKRYRGTDVFKVGGKIVDVIIVQAKSKREAVRIAANVFNEKLNKAQDTVQNGLM